jgi:gamma-glutamylcyclotransferase
MKTFLYAAYGSNLHPLRLKAPDRCPSAKLRGTSIVTGWRLAFRKRSTDGSTKCDTEKTGNPSDELRIAVFDIPESEEVALDNAEGLGNGYHKGEIQLTMDGEDLMAKIYLADEEAIVADAPYDWYKQMVLLGAEYHCFRNAYTDRIQEVMSKTDHDKGRARRKWGEVEQMRAANKTLAANAKQPRG